MTTQTMTKQSYLSELIQQVQQLPMVKSWLKEARDRASILLEELALPTKRDEAWQFTDLANLYATNFVLPTNKVVTHQDIAHLILPEAENSHLVFINGCYSPELSSSQALPEGIFIGNLSALPNSYLIENYLGKQQDSTEVFNAINTAGISDVAIVWVNQNVVVETPVHLLFITIPEATPTISQTRALVVLEPGAKLTLVEQYVATGEGCPDAPAFHPYFVNGVTEVFVQEKAVLSHTRVQRETSAAFHIARSAISQAKYSQYHCHTISLGAKISRHNLDIFQTGESTETTLNGLTMISGEQLADKHSNICLNYPNGITRQVHKTIVDDRASVVFNGRVFVGKRAQQTNAGQISRNLILSPKARVNTKPQLEIIADNVKCSHGATVSQLDGDEIFYLQSRGLDQAAATSLLVEAFALDIVNKLPVPSLRLMLSRCMACKTMVV
jgi:Fe-S cluster assembly protein SufD